MPTLDQIHEEAHGARLEAARANDKLDAQADQLTMLHDIMHTHMRDDAREFGRIRRDLTGLRVTVYTSLAFAAGLGLLEALPSAPKPLSALSMFMQFAARILGT